MKTSEFPPIKFKNAFLVYSSASFSVVLSFSLVQLMLNCSMQKNYSLQSTLSTSDVRNFPRITVTVYNSQQIC